MRFPLSEVRRKRVVTWCVAAAVAAAGSGCATQPTATRHVAREVAVVRAPEVESVRSPGEAWRRAETCAAALGDGEVVVGSGESMQPLLADRTVLVVRRLPMAELREGMTVVFTGDAGREVAHTLIEKTPRGWRAMGVGNAAPDRTLVRYGNYLGVVMRAFAVAERSGAMTGQERLIGAAPRADD